MAERARNYVGLLELFALSVSSLHHPSHHSSPHLRHFLNALFHDFHQSLIKLDFQRDLHVPLLLINHHITSSTFLSIRANVDVNIRLACFCVKSKSISTL